jgi:hypothetical protein
MASTEKKAGFNLTALTEGTMPGLSSVNGAQLAQAAAVCLKNREHRSGVTFHLLGVRATQFLMEWPPVDDQPAARTTTFRRRPSVGPMVSPS